MEPRAITCPRSGRMFVVLGKEKVPTVVMMAAHEWDVRTSWRDWLIKCLWEGSISNSWDP